jgi:hypothetical protein
MNREEDKDEDVERGIWKFVGDSDGNMDSLQKQSQRAQAVENMF